MDVNNLQRTPSYSYRVDADRIKQRLQQADKNSVSNQRQSDSVDISEEGRNALREKVSAIGRLGQGEDIGKLSSMNSGIYGMMNDFEKIMSELGGGAVSNDLVSKDYSQESVDALKTKFEKEEGTKTDTFDSYVNKMVSAYQLMKDRIEEKYAASDRQKEYYTAEDGSTQELTKEKELEMLDNAYETHSKLMATSTQIWSELKDFKVQINYHSSKSETEKATAKNQNTGIKEQAYNAFMSAINKENSGMLKQQTGSLNHVRLNLGISSSERNVLNSVWDYYANLKH
ncbi:MAG: hypothetical protein K2M22_04625 [Lachnospiraceae bacterium]|nr:hypothetical protein [Lachnospiraceae bacterium]MDE7179203.1 hypothetical protein [Lachnospiraceae bacterium]